MATPSKKPRVDRIGSFEIRQEIGRGSFATVFKGYRTTTDPPTPVAIKAVVRNKLTPKLLDNLESEIRLLKGISHPNVVSLIDCLKTEHHIYLIMGFCSGGDLSGYIKKRGQVEGLDESLYSDARSGSGPPAPLYPHPKEGGLNEVIVRSFLGQLSDALKFLRSQDIIHRDIKPQNLLLQSYSKYASTPHPEHIVTLPHPPTVPILQVADFGFARFLPQASMAETLCGSPLYMAPEILRYERYDAKADLWSVGAVLYEMCTGKPPFRAQNHVELLRRIEKGEDRIKFPDERSQPGEVAEVPADLKSLIRTLLKRNPAERMSFDQFFKKAEGVAVGGAVADIVRPKEETKPLAPKQPPQIVTRRSSFAPKYVTGSPSTPPLQHQESTQPVDIPKPSTLNEGAFVARERQQNRPQTGQTPDLVNASSHEGESPVRPTTPQSAPQSNRTAATADDDSVLGTEYVVVEKRAVEVNALADELANNQRPSVIARRSSRGFLSRPLGTLQGSPPVGSISSAPLTSTSSPYPPYTPASDELSSTPPFALSAQRSATISQSPRTRPSIIPYSSSPRSNSYNLGSLMPTKPGHAIVKAINLASLKLFGNPADGILLRRPSAKRKGIPRFDRVADPAELSLVAELEDLGQKASVIFDFADSKLLQLLPPTPQSGNISPSTANQPSPFNPSPSMRRTSSSSSERPVGLKQDVMAAEALLLYIRALAFLQRGIEKARAFWDSRSAAGYESTSAEFNEAVQWLRLRFNECYDKAEFSKARTQDEIPDSAVFTEKLIFDRALEVSRAAAVNELMGDNTADCETAYETALYMLYGIVDESMSDSASVKEEDRTTVNKFITSIEGRLSALRKKAGVQQS